MSFKNEYVRVFTTCDDNIVDNNDQPSNVERAITIHVQIFDEIKPGNEEAASNRDEIFSNNILPEQEKEISKQETIEPKQARKRKIEDKAFPLQRRIMFEHKMIHVHPDKVLYNTSEINKKAKVDTLPVPRFTFRNVKSFMKNGLRVTRYEYACYANAVYYRNGELTFELAALCTDGSLLCKYLRHPYLKHIDVKLRNEILDMLKEARTNVTFSSLPFKGSYYQYRTPGNNSSRSSSISSLESLFQDAPMVDECSGTETDEAFGSMPSSRTEEDPSSQMDLDEIDMDRMNIDIRNNKPDIIAELDGIEEDRDIKTTKAEKRPCVTYPDSDEDDKEKDVRPVKKKKLN